MPVEFFPDKRINQLEKLIIKEDGSPLHGEIDVYRLIHKSLSKSLNRYYVWHDLKLPFHDNAYNPYKKTEAQIDFLILSEEGLLVLEVKGGSISFTHNKFYYGNNFNKEMHQNPFLQAEGYKLTLQNKILNTKPHVFITYAVAFPHSKFNVQSNIFNKNIIWSKYSKDSFYDYDGENFELFIKNVFALAKKKQSTVGRIFPLLNSKELLEVKRILSPIYNDPMNYFNSDTLGWLQIDNLEILEGLIQNERIMIEGSPGSGKTTMAKAFIEKQGKKKGVYICWNRLLARKVKNDLSKRNLLNFCEVYTFSTFIQKICPSIDSHELYVATEDEFSQKVRDIVIKLISENRLGKYDYIVIDEGQDLFDRGIEIILEHMSGFKNGLDDGSSLILFDIDQSYNSFNRNVIEMFELLRPFYSYFKLNDVKRSAQNPEIKKISHSVLEIPSLSDFKFSKYKNTRINFFISLEHIKNYIVSNYYNELRKSNLSYTALEYIILVESHIFNPKDKPGMKFWLTIKGFEELTVNNISDANTLLKYTTILKYKGLEQKNVILVINKPTANNYYELYVGITRTIQNLEILILDEGANEISQ